MRKKFPKSLLHPKYLFSWSVVLILLIIAYLPLKTRHLLARLLAKFAYRYNHKRRNIIKANLKHCFPEFSSDKITQLTKENLFYLVLGIIEYGVMLFSSRHRLQNIIVVENLDYLKSLYKQKKGVLLLLAHSPLLEFAAPVLENFVYGDYYKKFKDPVINYLILRYRSRFIKKLVAREDGIGKIIKPLKNHKIFYYPADEDLGDLYSTFAPFFASQKSTLTTISRISKITKCLALPAIVVWDKNTKKYTVKFGTVFENYPSENIAQDARQLNHQLEVLIRPNLVQYMWSFKLFRTNISGSKNIYTKNQQPK